MNAFDSKFSASFSQEIIDAVGRLFLACAATETALSMQLARLASYPQPIKLHVPFIVSGMDLKVKLANIETCLLIIAPQEIDSARKITGSIRRQFDHRNAIAHNIAAQNGESVTVLMTKMVRKGPVLERTFTAKQIKSYADVTSARTIQLDQLLNKAGIPPTRPIPRKSIGEPQEHPQPHNDPPSDQAQPNPPQSSEG